MALVSYLGRRTASAWLVAACLVPACLAGGPARSQTTGPAAGVLFADPRHVTAQLATPGQECAGNGGPDIAKGGAWGMGCLFMRPRLEPGTAKPVYSQTYGFQVGIDMPPLPGDPGRLTDGRDQVALYPEVRQGAWSNGAWAINPLVSAGADAGGSIVDEADLNNFSGCDSPGIDTRTTGGSNPFVANRSDGSPCPSRIGILVTGVGNRVSSSAIAISGVSTPAGMMWQDGISMLGGYLVNEYEFYTDTLARTAIRIKGVHSHYGLDLSDGGFGFGAIGLASAAGNGRIVWACPASGCARGFPADAQIAPAADGALHLGGADLAVERSVQARGNIVAGPHSNFVSMATDGRPGAFFGTDPATGFGAIANATDATRNGLVTGTLRAASVEAGRVQADGAIRFQVRSRSTLPRSCTDGDTYLVRELRRLSTCLGNRFYADGRPVDAPAAD